jgi:Ca2+-binding RTX toxin-like protein
MPTNWRSLYGDPFGDLAKFKSLMTGKSYGGTTGNDNLTTTDGHDLIRTQSGNDVVYAKNGNDWLATGSGNDTVHAGLGHDFAQGGDGNDRLLGEDGNDELDGGAGNDVLLGGNGDDVLKAWTGNDMLEGGEGADYLWGGYGRDTILAGGGDDQIVGTIPTRDPNDNARSFNMSWIDTGGGRNNVGVYSPHIIALKGQFDRLEVEGSDLLYYGLGSLDLTVDSRGHTVLFQDVYVRGNRIDSFAEFQSMVRAGWIKATYEDQNAPGPYPSTRLILDLGPAADGTARIVNLGFSSEFGVPADKLDPSRFIISGTKAADGSPTTTNWESLYGNRFGDLAKFKAAMTGATYTGSDASQTTTATDGHDLIRANGGNDTVNARGGNDWISGGAGNDRLNTGSGHDFAQGGDGNDSLYGESGNDQLDGGAGTDRLEGGTGDDQLWDWTGNDVLIGGDGADTFYGGPGDDLAQGGNGDDYFDNATQTTGTDTDRLEGGAGANYYRLGAGREILTLTGAFDHVQGGSTTENKDEYHYYAQGGLTVVGGSGRIVFHDLVINGERIDSFAEFQQMITDGPIFARWLAGGNGIPSHLQLSINVDKPDGTYQEMILRFEASEFSARPPGSLNPDDWLFL